MRVLHFGGSGNLGSKMIPALLSHGHTVIAFVRSPEKLESMMSPDILERITIVRGDAMDSNAITTALKEHNCDAVTTAAGNWAGFVREQTLGPLVASITSAATIVGRERGKPLRAWIIGGIGSLQYPGTKYQIQDYLPDVAFAQHHLGTERVMKAIPLGDLEWSVLCVAMMTHESRDKVVQLWTERRKKNLLVSANEPPGWLNHWIGNVPVFGKYLNLVPAIAGHRAKYEDVADLIAEDLEQQKSEYVGEFVGYKAMI